MKCGVTIGLFWMAQDHVMGEGSGNRKARGMARYFQPFRNIDKSNRTWMMGKLKNYCNTRIDQDMPSSGGGYSESNTAK